MRDSANKNSPNILAVLSLGMELKVTAELKTVWKQTLAQLSGAARRMFMASVVKGLGRGGARQAQIQLGWDRTTLRKGLHELNSGIVCVDALSQRGRKPMEARLSNLEADLDPDSIGLGPHHPPQRAARIEQRDCLCRCPFAAWTQTYGSPLVQPRSRSARDGGSHQPDRSDLSYHATLPAFDRRGGPAAARGREGLCARGGALGTQSAAQTQRAGFQAAAGGQEQALAQSAADRRDL